MDPNIVYQWLLSILQIIWNLFVWILCAQLAFTTLGTLCNALRIKLGEKTEPEAKKVIIITGATAGFGLLLTKHFYKIGFSVVAGYFNEQESGFKELNELRSQRYDIFGSGAPLSCEPHLFLVKIDVREQESISSFGKQVNTLIEEENLKLFALINNAGIGNAGSFEWMSTDSISSILDTNLKGTLLVSRQFMRDIIKNQGRIINVSSCTFLFPGRGISAYATTKAAVTSFSELLHEDLKLHGASCCCIMAGNFISVSDIVYTMFRSVQDSCSRLSSEERMVFKKSIDEQSEIVTKLLRKKMKSETRKPSEIEAQFKIDLPTHDEKKGTLLQLIKDSIYKLLSPMDGRSESLESSNLAQVFELAICLSKPPNRLYAGNPMYTYVLGPSMEFMAPYSRLQLKPLINELIFRV